MTVTKKKSQAGRTGQVPAAYDLDQRNPLTREESRHLLSIIHGALSDTGDASLSTALLLLVNALAFEEDAGERFALWCDARSMFALELTGLTTRSKGRSALRWLTCGKGVRDDGEGGSQRPPERYGFRRTIRRRCVCGR